MNGMSFGQVGRHQDAPDGRLDPRRLHSIGLGVDDVLVAEYLALEVDELPRVADA